MTSYPVSATHASKPMFGLIQKSDIKKNNTFLLKSTFGSLVICRLCIYIKLLLIHDTIIAVSLIQTMLRTVNKSAVHYLSQHVPANTMMTTLHQCTAKHLLVIWNSTNNVFTKCTSVFFVSASIVSSMQEYRSKYIFMEMRQNNLTL